MTKIYTELTLLKYLYNESDFFETLEVEFALQDSKVVREAYKELKSKVGLLHTVSLTPSQKCISNVLDYSKRTAQLVKA